MQVNYLYTPCYSDSSLTRRIEEASDKLQKAYAEVFDSWLERCVKDFCPEAWQAIHNRNDHIGAVRELNKADFHYRTYPDGTAEFCQGDTVLARAKFEIKFTVNSGSS